MQFSAVVDIPENDFGFMCLENHIALLAAMFDINIFVVCFISQSTINRT